MVAKYIFLKRFNFVCYVSISELDYSRRVNDAIVSSASKTLEYPSFPALQREVCSFVLEHVGEKFIGDDLVCRRLIMDSRVTKYLGASALILSKIATERTVEWDFSSSEGYLHIQKISDRRKGI